jgi:hypothetical protein
LGVLDSDDSDTFDAESFDKLWNAAPPNSKERDALKLQLISYITAVRRSTDDRAVRFLHRIVEDAVASYTV